VALLNLSLRELLAPLEVVHLEAFPASGTVAMKAQHSDRTLEFTIVSAVIAFGFFVFAVAKILLR
jgi:hypothetical protein